LNDEFPEKNMRVNHSSTLHANCSQTSQIEMKIKYATRKLLSEEPNRKENLGDGLDGAKMLSEG
jgi:hypothetical protein